MKRDDLINAIEKLPGAVLEYPFGDDVMVYKVMNKMYALVGDTKGLNLKCDPNDAIAYRDIYENVIPGYHMNKKHWNTILFDKDDSIPDDIIVDMVKESYDLVVSKLTKKQKIQLETLN